MIIKADFCRDDIIGVQSFGENGEKPVFYQNPNVFVSLADGYAAVELDGTTPVDESEISFCNAALYYNGNEIDNSSSELVDGNWQPVEGIYMDLIDERTLDPAGTNWGFKIKRLPYKGTYQLYLAESRYSSFERVVTSSKTITFTTNGKWVYEIDSQKSDKDSALMKLQKDFTSDLPYIPSGIVDIEMHGKVFKDIQHFVRYGIFDALKDENNILIYGNLLFNIDLSDVKITDITYSDESMAEVEFNPELNEQTQLLSIVIPNGITKIADGAISDCPNLETIYLPESLASLDGENGNITTRRPFTNCGKKFVIPETNQYFTTSQDGTMILSKDGSTILMFAEGISAHDIKDESITSIDEGVNTNNVSSIAIDTSKVFVKQNGTFGDVKTVIFKNAELTANDFEKDEAKPEQDSTYNMFCNIINTPLKKLVFQGTVEIPNTIVQEDNGEISETIKPFFARFANTSGTLYGLKSIIFNGNATIQERAFANIGMGSFGSIYDSETGTSVEFNADATIDKAAFYEAELNNLKFNSSSKYVIAEEAFYKLANESLNNVDFEIAELDLRGATSIGSYAFGPDQYYEAEKPQYYNSPIQKVLISAELHESIPEELQEVLQENWAVYFFASSINVEIK